jgi:F-box interacting protein
VLPLPTPLASYKTLAAATSVIPICRLHVPPMARDAQKKERDAERSPLSELSDDLLVEIISRVPYKFTRCCKCVCRRWRDLVSHPDHRKKLPWSTLAGFFYKTFNQNSSRYTSPGYQSVSGNWCPRVDRTLSFLPDCVRFDIYLLDSCNGLLLLRRRDSKDFGSKIDYIVCNPATETWVPVPSTEWRSDKIPETKARLGFDPAVSSHFHVFEFLHTVMWETGKGYNGHVKSVRIYSSETGVWMHQSAWDQPIAIYGSSRSAFIDGVLYLSSYEKFAIAVIDVEGNCKVICVPALNDHRVASDLYLSKGQLYLAHYGALELSIWVLEDCSRGYWTLKHSVSHLQLFGKGVPNYNVIIHPEDDVIYIICRSFSTSICVTKLMSYKMDSRELYFICDLGRGIMSPYFQPYLPYVPSFVE